MSNYEKKSLLIFPSPDFFSNGIFVLGHENLVVKAKINIFRENVCKRNFFGQTGVDGQDLRSELGLA